MDDSYIGKEQLYKLGSQEEFNPYLYNSGIAHLAEYNEWGRRSRKNSYPFRVFFVPNNGLKYLYTKFPAEVQKIPPDTNLYTVYAQKNPELGCISKIGFIRLKSKLLESSYANESLTFQEKGP